MNKIFYNNRVIAIQADHIKSLNLPQDSTILIMNELLRRGYTIFWYLPKNLFIKEGIVQAEGYIINEAINQNNDIYADYDSYPVQTVALDEIEMILIRQDPPFNIDYLYSLQLLYSLKDRVHVVNNPISLAIYSEKLIPLYIEKGKYMPPTLITDNIDYIKPFLIDHKSIVLKDFWGYGGINIKKITQFEELKSMDFSNQIVAQKFLPRIAQGDLRVTMVEGEILCVTTRIPAPGNFISNLHANGEIKAIDQIDSTSLKICQSVGHFLVENDIFLAGIDIIDGFLIEVNITSVGAIIHANRLYNKQFEKILVDKLEAKML